MLGEKSSAATGASIRTVRTADGIDTPIYRKTLDNLLNQEGDVEHTR